MLFTTISVKWPAAGAENFGLVFKGRVISARWGRGTYHTTFENHPKNFRRLAAGQGMSDKFRGGGGPRNLPPFASTYHQGVGRGYLLLPPLITRGLGAGTCTYHR